MTSNEQRPGVSAAMIIGGWRPEKTCAQGKAATCTQRGILYEKGQGGLSARGGILRKACDGGIAYGCGTRAGMYYRDNEIAVDKARGLALMNQACRMGDSWSCNKLKELGK